MRVDRGVGPIVIINTLRGGGLPRREHRGAADSRIRGSADQRLSAADVNGGSNTMFALNAKSLIFLATIDDADDVISRRNDCALAGNVRFSRACSERRRINDANENQDRQMSDDYLGRFVLRVTSCKVGGHRNTSNARFTSISTRSSPM